MNVKYVIFWWNQARAEREWEVFESLKEAKRQLKAWGEGYPWNTYRLARITAVQKASAVQPIPHGDMLILTPKP